MSVLEGKGRGSGVCKGDVNPAGVGGLLLNREGSVSLSDDLLLCTCFDLDNVSVVCEGSESLSEGLLLCICFDRDNVSVVCGVLGGCGVYAPARADNARFAANSRRLAASSIAVLLEARTRDL